MGKIEANFYNIEISEEKLEKELTFAFVSDLHGYDNSQVFKILEKNSPDALLVGGDSVHDMTNYLRGFEFFEKAASLYKTFAVLGNHETRYEGDIRSEITKRGAVLLDNSHINFHGINIGGLTAGDFYENKKPDTAWLESFAVLDGFKLLLCHRPEYFPKYIKKLDIDMTLSGHAHGGQWRFFSRGLYAPGQGILPKYTQGMYENRLNVSRGIGNPHLVPRINNRPEIVFLRLKRI